MPESDRTPILCWLSRGLAVLYLGLLVLLSMDAFQEGQGPMEAFVALLMHLIPALVFLAALIVAWRRPMLGGWLLLGLGCLATLYFGTYRHFSGFMAVTLPLVLLGALFFLEGFWHSTPRHS